MDRYSDNLAVHISWSGTPHPATSLSELDDQALIAAISARDGNALATLYARYAGVLYRMVLRMLKSPELAEEVVQEVFWRVWRRSASFETTCAVGCRTVSCRLSPNIIATGRSRCSWCRSWRSSVLLVRASKVTDAVDSAASRPA